MARFWSTVSFHSATSIKPSTGDGGVTSTQSSNSGLAVSRLELDREGSRFDSEGGWGEGLSKNRDLVAFFPISLLV